MISPPKIKATRFLLAVVLLSMILIMIALSGCSTQLVRSKQKSDPFNPDRVSTIRLLMKNEDWQKTLKNAYAEKYVQADFWFNNELVPSIGVRPKGNSSLGQAVVWGSPRIPLAIDFNLFNKARSFHGVKKIFLNNGWSDPTLIRDCLGYETFASIGVPSPRASLVDLWVNDIHLGVYTMVEAVDTAFLSRHYSDASGNLYKPELMSARLDWTEEDLMNQRRRLAILNRTKTPVPETNQALEVNLGGGRLIDILESLNQENTVAGYVPSPTPENNPRGIPPVKLPADYLEAMALKTNESNPDHSALFRFLEILNREPDQTFPQKIESVLDVDETLRFLAVSALIIHLDNYIGIGHNNYLYEENGKFHLIPWDLNMAFGTFNNGIKKNGLINFYIDEPTAGPVYRYLLVKRLLSYPPYLEKYHFYLEQLVNGPCSKENIEARIDHYANLVAPYAAKDSEYFYSRGDWVRCLNEDLRPPDAFEGWMAGGPSPMLPWLTSEELAKLRQFFQINALWDFFNMNLTQEDLNRIRSCLPPEKYKIFLQNMYGPLESPQPPGQPGFGPNSPGLKPFILARIDSVKKQLAGQLPRSSGTGAGNGGSLWMVDWMMR